MEWFELEGSFKALLVQQELGHLPLDQGVGDQSLYPPSELLLWEQRGKARLARRHSLVRACLAFSREGGEVCRELPQAQLSLALVVTPFQCYLRKSESDNLLLSGKLSTCTLQPHKLCLYSWDQLKARH